MVQRKVMANKLGIQDDDHNKIEKLLPSSSQNQDIKNKGAAADLKKKKMKKSGSFKKPDFERLHSSRKPVKPPPLVLPIKTMIEATPNYMKATTSSDSKKERVHLQVSSQTPQASSDSKRSSRRNSKNNSDSGNKPTRTLARTSSLKLVRTLTKAPSFKLARASAKKKSPINIEKATCSSTMKGHKFPDYLTLNPGATEAEGTSAMKVCSYSYCSLNGHHHHEPLPPLKSFLSARRRMVKAQRGLKLGCLSPRRAKPIRDILKEFEAAQGNDDATPPPFEESASFFVEIYSKEREETFQNNQNTTDSSVTDVKPSSGVANEDEEAVEIDSHESHLQSRDVTFADMDADDYLAQGKTKPDFLNLSYELEAERTPSIQSEEADVEASDMDWETGMHSASYPYDGVANPILINHVVDLLDEVAFKSGESIIGDNCKEKLPDEIIQESIDDETEEEDDKDRTNTVVDAMDAIDSAPVEKAIEKESLTSDDKPEDVTPEVGNQNNIIETQYKDVAVQQTSNQEFGDRHVMSETLKRSIGTQTDSEFEDPQDVSGNLHEVLKRSIGTQTDFEDDQVQDCSFATQCNSHSTGLESSENEIDEATETAESIILDQPQSEMVVSSFTGHADQNIHETEMDGPAQDASSTRVKVEPVGSNLNEESTICGIKKGTPKAIVENQQSTEFNPRDPNFLPIQPEPEAEKVDLRHLMLDEGKNADDWKLDHALQQAVTKLASARKKKVALLVEAFETVLPIPKYETQFRHTSTTFSHVRPMQACS